MKRYRSASTGRYISESKKRRIDCFIENNVRKIVNDHSYSSRPTSHENLENPDVDEPVSLFEDDNGDQASINGSPNSANKTENSNTLCNCLDEVDGENECETGTSWRQGRRIVELGFLVANSVKFRYATQWYRGKESIQPIVYTEHTPCSKTTLKKREREIGQAVEEIAHSSGSDAAVRERELTEESPVSASFDGGWQKRGSWKSYSSLSGQDCEIIQIGAAYTDEHSFSKYLLPSKRISTSAIALTGLTVAGNQMYKEGQPVQATSPCEGLRNFLHWLSTIHKPIVLMAHNDRFDANVFCRALIGNKLKDDAGKVIQGFVDTLPLFRKSVPGLSSYKQTDLVKCLLQTYYCAHDAASDAKSLLQLVNSQTFLEDLFLQHSFSLDSYINVIQYHERVQKNNSSLICLVDNNVISKLMMTHIAKSGLSLSHLLLAYKRDPENGVFHLFSERTIEGKARVTCNKKIIGNLCVYLKSMSN
ncbi:uncharacterized protein LOC133204856 [Saccostrea echinata]|uniref:uncharacterized protein LOC133204856 n=1 Tax=Saccostrea echinata TaxID=191078 RepID=UPI002A821319|nr:uncharacterized protein LOC133204856 [Saccostrea echinata]